MPRRIRNRRRAAAPFTAPGTGLVWDLTIEDVMADLDPDWQDWGRADQAPASTSANVVVAPAA